MRYKENKKDCQVNMTLKYTQFLLICCMSRHPNVENLAILEIKFL